MLTAIRIFLGSSTVKDTTLCLYNCWWFLFAGRGSKWIQRQLILWRRFIIFLPASLRTLLLSNFFCWRYPSCYDIKEAPKEWSTSWLLLVRLFRKLFFFYYWRLFGILWTYYDIRSLLLYPCGEFYHLCVSTLQVQRRLSCYIKKTRSHAFVFTRRFFQVHSIFTSILKSFFSLKSFTCQGVKSITLLRLDVCWSFCSYHPNFCIILNLKRRFGLFIKASVINLLFMYHYISFRSLLIWRPNISYIFARFYFRDHSILFWGNFCFKHSHDFFLCRHW